MNAPLPQRVGPWLRNHLPVVDPVLLAVVGVLSLIGLVTLYSAASDHPGRFGEQLRNFALATGVMIAVAGLPPRTLKRLALPTYAIGLLLLLAVLVAGVSVKGAQRWLELGPLRIQPAEIMKLAVPLMLAWYFDRREGAVGRMDFAIAALLVLVPVALIVRQPDLGTAMLVLAAGFFVIFFAGLPWIWLGALVGGAVAMVPLAWTLMHDYQRNRILTLVDPMSDPLGKGFHTLQAMIAIGSGGVLGKGWMQGTQTHLEFIPERTSDFIFAVYSEEFGLIGNLVLLVLFMLLVGRALQIALQASTPFTRLLGSAIAMILFTYTFVNMAMVSGILPVVGVPLPFISYGGTALVTLGMACGMLMCVQSNRKMVQM
ncbi:MAG TPA: rod shape-determining protein RodA [Burkholderiaceae bacterium]|nr:rod shape-determining protein RodA [Burkholderiaceae bacterium]